MKLLTWLRLPLFFVGLFLLMAADRYISFESYHLALRITAGALIGAGFLMTLGLALLAKGQGLPGEARGWRYLVWWQLTVVAGVGAYYGYLATLGDAPTPETMAQKAMLAVWLVLLTLGISSGLGLEWAMRET